MRQIRFKTAFLIGLLILLCPTLAFAKYNTTDANTGSTSTGNSSSSYSFDIDSWLDSITSGNSSYGSSSSGSSSSGSSSKPSYPETVTINGIPSEMQIGDSVKASVETSEAKNTNVTWSSDNEAVVKADKNKITAVSAGTATVTAASKGGASSSVTVTVLPVQSTSVTIQALSSEPEAGSQYQLSASVKPDNTADKSITWTSSDPMIAQVDQTGLVSFKKAGTVTIIARNGATTGSLDITVKKVELQNLTVTTEDGKQEFTLNKGDTEQLTVKLNPENATVDSISWSSSDEKIATVDQNGLVTAVSSGKVTITAAAEGKSACVIGHVTNHLGAIIGITAVIGGGGLACFLINRKKHTVGGTPEAVTAEKQNTEDSDIFTPEPLN